MSEFASKGVGGAGLGLGIAGTALGVMNGGLGNLFNGFGGGAGRYGYGDEAYTTHRESGLNARIAELETEVKLRDANTYTLTEMGRLRDYVDRRFDGVNAQISTQAVINAQVASNLACMQGNIATLMGLTKTVVPIGNVCPEPMPAHNSWTAPVATT